MAFSFKTITIFFISAVLLEGEGSFLFLARSKAPEVLSLPLGNSSSCELSIDEYPDWPYGGPTFLRGDFITIWDWGRVPRCLSLHPLLGVWGEIISPLLWSILFSSTTTLSKGDPIILGGYAMAMLVVQMMILMMIPLLYIRELQESGWQDLPCLTTSQTAQYNTLSHDGGIIL